MALPKYSAEKRRALAQVLHIEDQYLYQILRGLRVASAALARRMNCADPACRLQDLRPNDWRDIWPELAEPLAVNGQDAINTVAASGAFASGGAHA